MLVAVLWPRALTDGAKYLHEMMIISSYFSTFMKRVVLHIFGHSFFPSSFFFNGQLRYFPLFFFVGLQTSIMWNKFTTIACHQMAVLFIFDWGQSHLSQCQKGWIEFELNFNQPISDLNLILGPCDQFFFRLLFCFFFLCVCFGRLLRREFGMGSDDSRIRKKNRGEREMTSLSPSPRFLFIYLLWYTQYPAQEVSFGLLQFRLRLIQKRGKDFFPQPSKIRSCYRMQISVFSTTTTTKKSASLSLLPLFLIFVGSIATKWHHKIQSWKYHNF